MSSNPYLATAAFRLSLQQERVWSQHDRGAQTFAQCTIRLEGQLDVAVLQAALRKIVSRYEILRTVFRKQTGIRLPFQVIQEAAGFHFEKTDQEGAIEELLRRERGFLSNFEDGPMLRAVLLTADAQRHLLVLTVPALCADAATLRNLRAEITAQYGSAEVAESAEVMQYADLVEWQNE